MASQTAVVHSPVLSSADLSPDVDWPLANSPAIRARPCLRTQCTGETRSLDRERALNTTAALGLSPTRARTYSPSTSPLSAEISWADAVAAGRRKDGERPAVLSPLGCGSASALHSPCSGGSPAWRPAALAAVRSPLAPVVRHRATASVDMEELWAEEASDETGGAARRPRRNRMIIRRARNKSSDFSSLRSALGDEKPPGSADAGSDRRAATGWVPAAPSWEGEAPDSAEPQLLSAEGSDASAAARPSIISRRTAATAIRKLRIFSNRSSGRDSELAAAFAAPAASAAAGNDVALEGLEGVSAQPSRTRDKVTAGSAAGAGGNGGGAIPKSPPRRRGPAGVAARRRNFSGSSAEPVTVVPFVRREQADKQLQAQQPSQESSPPSHIKRSLSSSGAEGRQEAAGPQDIADVLRAPALPGRSGDSEEAGETKRSGETDGEESRGQQRVASYHEELALDLMDYFGDVAQSWSIGSSNRDCDSVVHPHEAEAAAAPMLKVVLNNQSPSLTKDQLLTSLRSEEMRIGVAPRSDGVATFGAGTKVGSSGKGNWDKGGKHGGSGSSSDTNSGRWGQGKGKAGVLDFPWGSKGMAPRGLCHGCWDEGHAWQRCPHRPKGGISAFLKRGGRGSNGKAQVADEEEQDDKAEAVVGEAVAAVGEEQPREGWWIDSGASHNFTPYASDFKSKLQPPEVRGVILGDGRMVKAVGMGEVPVVGAGGQLLRIQKVHLVPEMHTRLLSVPHLTSRDVIVTFKGKKCVLKRGGRVLAIGEKERGRDHGLVRMSLPLARGTQGSALAAGSSSSFSPLTLAHRRLGHTAPTTLQQMARGNSVLGLEIGGGEH
ncbi:unnamed protein product [Closterium sp. Naga37s-1]|nr:unnamed protein product [Closterium sp. Naga37s-1]